MLIFVILILLIIPIDVVSRECPQNSSEWRQKEIIFSCPSGTHYHCLLDEKGLTTEMCFEKTWIQPGFCPEFNSMSKKMDVSFCTESRGICSLRTYWSNDVLMYTACMPRNYIRNGSLIGSQTGATPQVIKSENASTKRNQSSKIGKEASVTVIIVPLIVGLIVLCGVIAVVYIWHKRRGLTNDRTGKPAEPDTTSPLMIAPSTTDDGEHHIEQKAKDTETENYSKDKKKTETLASVAVEASNKKKLLKVNTFEYSAKIVEEAGPRLTENGILLLVCQSKKFMAEVGQSLALTCHTQEFPSGFQEFLDSFVEMEKNVQKTKCVVFNDCFQDRDTIEVLEDKSVFNELHEKQVASEGRLRFVIAIPMKVWNTRKFILSKWNLFNEKYIFKISYPPI